MLVLSANVKVGFFSFNPLYSPRYYIAKSKKFQLFSWYCVLVEAISLIQAWLSWNPFLLVIFASLRTLWSFPKALLGGSDPGPARKGRCWGKVGLEEWLDPACKHRGPPSQLPGLIMAEPTLCPLLPALGLAFGSSISLGSMPPICCR